MKKGILTAVICAMPVTIMAQSAVDALQIGRYDLRGTARFMSMGGAFGALGGDLSSLSQNPAGVGVYRRNDIGITLDIDIQRAKSNTPLMSYTQDQTKAFLNNVGYVGTIRLDSEIMPFFNFGISYNRVASFNRRYRGADVMKASLSNYIAGYTTQEEWTTNDLSGTNSNYFNSYGAPWMSILAYNSYLINPVGSASSTNYNGLWQNGVTSGEYEFDVEETGGVNEYNIDFGGNLTDVVYWGVGVGIVDVDYNQSIYYQEFLKDAKIPVQNESGEIVAGDATPTPQEVGFGLLSNKSISGTGFNFKAGVIVRPINELRLGLAVHTPTYYPIRQVNDGTIDYGYGYSDGALAPSYAGTPVNSLDWNLRTPWRLIASAAAVIGPNAIISADYEYRPYQSMSAKDNSGREFSAINGDIKDYYKASNIIRVGAEYRVSNHVSLRAGYAFESTPSTTEFKNNEYTVFTSGPYDTGTTPSYSVDNSTQYITCGLGYRYGNFYADAAYVNKSGKTDYHAFTPNQYTEIQPGAEVKSSSNNIVLTLGVKF